MSLLMIFLFLHSCCFRFGIAATPQASSSSTINSRTYCLTDSFGPDTPFTQCYTRPLGWYTKVWTIPATTITEDPWTNRDDATTVTFTGTSYEGIPIDTETYTYTAATKTYLAGTETLPERVRTTVAQPVLFSGLFPPDVLDLLHDFAPEVTSVTDGTASKINRDIEGLWSSYTSANPQPTIFTKVYDDLSSQIDKGYSSQARYLRSIYSNMAIFPSSAAGPAMTSSLSSLLQPYPSLQSEVNEYLSTGSAWWAPLYLAQITAVVRDLNITTPLPSWLSTVSAALPSGTGSGANGSSNRGANVAISIRGPSLLVNAVVATAGLVLIGLM